MMGLRHRRVAFEVANLQSKPLSWDQIRSNATAFVHEWAGESSERGESQSFWTELLAVYGIRRRKVAQYETRAKCKRP